MAAPLINDYKKEFVRKRLIQTFLGGPKLALGYSAPCYVYLMQIMIFSFPAFLGALFTVIAENALMQPALYLSVYGVLMGVFVVTVQVVSACFQENASAVLKFRGNNVLAQDDVIEFTSFLGPQTWEFIVPLKKYKTNLGIHALVSGVMCSFCLHFLKPSVVGSLFENQSSLWTIVLWGWFTVCVAHYPLAVAPPPETATFQPLDTFEIAALSRPFHVILCVTAQWVICFMEDPPQWLKTLDWINHVGFVFLPFLWLFGVLPPIDAFLLWSGEQIVVFLFGGSPKAKDIKLLVSICLSVIQLIFVWFICAHDMQLLFLISAITGYILSVDIGGIFDLVVRSKEVNNQFGSNSKGTKYVAMSVNGVTFPQSSPYYSVRSHRAHGISEILVHVILLIGVALLVGYQHEVIEDTSNCGFNKTDNVTFSLLNQEEVGTEPLSYTCVFLYFIFIFTNEIQKVYIIFGFVRNPCYLLCANNVVRKTMATLKAILLYIGIPFFLVVYIEVVSKRDCIIRESLSSDNILLRLLTIIAVLKTFRWIWQIPDAALLDAVLLTVIDNLLQSHYSHTNIPFWSSTSHVVKFMIISILRDRMAQVLNKSYLVFLLLVSPCIPQNQIKENDCHLLLTSVCFLPLTIFTILISALLSSPLLPLFTLPLFIVGFPRPTKFWPGAVGRAASTCSDSVYYQQMVPHVASAFHCAVKAGVLGTVYPGHHFLLRIDDRLLWTMVLERGHGYVYYGIKGLELQETSCHFQEASQVDDVFNGAFSNDKQQQLINTFWLNTLTPLCTINIESYSSARNSLTGVIESPSTLKLVSTSFLKCFVWVLIHYCAKGNMDRIQGTEQLNMSQSDTNLKSPILVNKLPKINKTIDLELKQNRNSKNCRSSSADIKELKVQNLQVSVDPSELEWSRSCSRPDSGSGDPAKWASMSTFCKTLSHEEQKEPLVNSTFSIPTLKSWSDEDDPLEMDVLKPRNRLPPIPLRVENIEISSQDMLQVHALPGILNFGETSVNGAYQNREAWVKNMESRSDLNESGIMSMPTTGTRSDKIPNYRGPLSCALAPLQKWLDIPVEDDVVETLEKDFPLDWYSCVVQLVAAEYNKKKQVKRRDAALDEEEIEGMDVENAVSDPALEEMYRKVVLGCYSIIHSSDADYGVESLGPSHVHKLFHGDIPWSLHSEWLMGEKELLQLVLKAYRCGVKLAIDQALLGEITTTQELEEYMHDYDHNWFIGSEDDPGWNEAVLKETPNLFSLGFVGIPGSTMGEYRSHLLTLREVTLQVGRLNSEVVQGLWASLALELLYLTNDDEERYSIQAHRAALRNLTVQASDPPLGYPIYSSQPIRMSHNFFEKACDPLKKTS